MVALIVLGLCFITPFIAMFAIQKSKKENREILDQQDDKEGREVVAKKKVGFCENLFMGEHVPLTKRREAAFEARILRDSYSALYAMCEQRAYKWFVMDLFRKAIVTAIYTFGKDGQYDYMYVLLIFFSIFAINHDITQPYRGRTENLFGLQWMAPNASERRAANSSLLSQGQRCMMCSGRRVERQTPARLRYTRVCNSRFPRQLLAHRPGSHRPSLPPAQSHPQCRSGAGPCAGESPPAAAARLPAR
jgi:hypothetical protein